MTDLERLSQLIRKFPGIGTRQAGRIAQWIVEQDHSYGRVFTETLAAAQARMRLCPVSFQYFEDDGSGQTLAPLVRDPSRDKSVLMIVEKQADLDSVESLRVYRGQYFVLGDLSGGQEDVWKASPRVRALLNRLKTDSDLNEVILALSVTPDGDRTALLLSVLIHDVNADIKISTLGRGLSSGSELEYLDQETMKAALERRSVSNAIETEADDEDEPGNSDEEPF
jgi:recombination protein RecR